MNKSILYRVTQHYTEIRATYVYLCQNIMEVLHLCHSVLAGTTSTILCVHIFAKNKTTLTFFINKEQVFIHDYMKQFMSLRGIYSYLYLLTVLLLPNSIYA